MLASSGYVSKVDHELCIGCGVCAGFCQFDAIDIIDGLAEINSARCMGCGICTSKCDQKAITLQRDPARGEPLDICALQENAGKVVQNKTAALQGRAA
jgi:MinD superfamily P-loop ATPase